VYLDGLLTLYKTNAKRDIFFMLGIMMVASTRQRHEGQNIKPNLHLVVALMLLHLCYCIYVELTNKWNYV